MLANKVSSVDFDFYDPVLDIVAASNTLIVSNLSHPFEMVFFNQPTDISIGGTRRSNVRDFDARLEFDWQDVRTQESEIISFLNNIITYKDTPSVIRFNVTGTTDYLYVVPEQAVYNQNYINQIKRTPTTARFLLESLRSSISYD